MTKHYEIIVGTMLGAAEYVADAIAASLSEKSATTTIHTEPKFEDINQQATWVVCTSTHGAGELPDNIQEFAKALNTADLPGTQVVIIGLGDTSYDTFCYGAKEIETKLVNAGATLLTDPLHIDVLEHPIPEDEAVQWFESNVDVA